MAEPVFTFILPVKNAARTIEKTLQSMEAQAYPGLDLIVLDALSTDGTQAIVERYRHVMSHFASRADTSPYDALIEGAQLAKGEWIGMLGGDDWLAPDALRALAQLAHLHPQARMLCFSLTEEVERADGTAPRGVYPSPPGNRFTLLDGLYCHGLTQLYHRELLDTYWRFDKARWPQLADRDLYMRLGRAGISKACAAGPLYHFLIHPGSNSMSGRAQKTYEMLGETLSVARHWLQRNDLLPTERALIADWFSFNAWRAAYFACKAGHRRAALHILLEGIRRFPVCMVKRLFFYRMPRHYRRVTAAGKDMHEHRYSPAYL